MSLPPGVDEQIAHLAWHGYGADHWHVGVTALDDLEDGRLTEDVTTLMGMAVHRTLELPRTTILLMSSEATCHRPPKDDDWDPRRPGI